MAAKGGRIKRVRDAKFIVSRHGRSKPQGADACERAIEKRERRLGRAEIAEQLAENEPACADCARVFTRDCRVYGSLCEVCWNG